MNKKEFYDAVVGDEFKSPQHQRWAYNLFSLYCRKCKGEMDYEITEDRVKLKLYLSKNKRYWIPITIWKWCEHRSLPEKMVRPKLNEYYICNDFGANRIYVRYSTNRKKTLYLMDKHGITRSLNIGPQPRNVFYKEEKLYYVPTMLDALEVAKELGILDYEEKRTLGNIYILITFGGMNYLGHSVYSGNCYKYDNVLKGYAPWISKPESIQNLMYSTSLFFDNFNLHELKNYVIKDKTSKHYELRKRAQQELVALLD